eukprot:EG_transcript_31770
MQSIAGGQQSAEKGIHDLEGAMRGFSLGLQSCSSQTQNLQGAVQNVEKGVQSALGQVANQFLSSEFSAARINDKLLQVERDLKEKSSSSTVAVPAPVVVPVTVNVEPVIAMQKPADLVQPVPARATPEIGFVLEPLEEGPTPLFSGSFPSLQSGNQGPTYSIRPVSAGGGTGGQHHPVLPLGGDLVVSEIAKSIRPPRFD